MRNLSLLITLLIVLIPSAQAWQSTNERIPEPPREFRAAWVASVFNLDWPSRAGLSAAVQQQELLRILDTAHKLHLNAIILQVRPNGDALYNSRLEPWSAWLSGPGSNPGYDPLAFAIAEAHRRGLELHAWFNPFRATISGKPVGRNHIANRRSDLVKHAGATTILNPSSLAAQRHVLSVIMDVVQRYDIDGVHLDDYFYPYPPNHNIADGKTPAQRRAAIDTFVRNLYQQVKHAKPWVRVGISPFGIWQPGYPSGVKAGVNAYEHLACDAPKWLRNGWIDYLSPQLYWRINSDQSFPALMQWWSRINPSRPIWPGIATARINSLEDPGRPASEIGAQIDYSRKLANRAGAGELFWSWKSLGSNRGGVQSELTRRYNGYALPPPMPWSSATRPGRPTLQIHENAQGCSISWEAADNAARKWVLQVGSRGRWFTMGIMPAQQRRIQLPARIYRTLDRIAIRPIAANGLSGIPAVSAR